MYEIAGDMSIVLMIMLIANIIFNNFEKHLPLIKRVIKHGLLFLILCLIRYFLDRIGLLITLGILTIGQIILHAWWFPKNGVNGLTAQPYDKYLKLIDKMKNKN